MMLRLVIFVLSIWFFPFQSLGSTSLATVRNRANSSTFQRRFDPADQLIENGDSHLSDKRNSLFQQMYFWDIDLDLDKDFKLDTLFAIYDLTVHLLYPNQTAYVDSYTSYADLPVQSRKFLLFEQIKIPL
ncbi:hypothetical protein [Sphingobacterium sp. UDSM-2020]|uniref:hypothetical protein n=1 Tax=Sphingobacterium sp. UDSM-2020 TaxID=2795738 RepID=UPI001937C27A|nr:hypothetical protein [Sphingobacterium sp. UDSM-2020]QQD16266.1 hypothetical protein JAZ75_12395 [Sphingobacterium sp. UDSM-2020]